MYLNVDKQPPNKLAAIDSNNGVITYGKICENAIYYKNILEPRSVVFLLCENSIGALNAYISCIESKCVPLILSSKIDEELLDKLRVSYKPTYIWGASNKKNLRGTLIDSNLGYDLLKTSYGRYSVNPDLSLLLSTSGSTGSPKLVRHSYKNLLESAKNISAFFDIKNTDKPLVDLPMFYTMGHSVICSYIYSGATLLLTSLSLLSADFWKFFSENKATVFTGVPYSYQILKRIKFMDRRWPHLKILTQGGGKLNDNLYKEFAEYALRNNISFIPTFGQTECTARMAFLSPEKSIHKVGSIGKAIPGGRLFLVDDFGNEILENNVEGELGYSGPNVTMGYAMCCEDLLKGDEWNGSILTGDIAIRDQDGCYYIVGRKKRFLKLYGCRISLDQCEKLIKNEFNIDCACIGTDEKMQIFIEDSKLVDKVKRFLSLKTGLVITAFEVIVLKELPRNEYGKIKYKNLQN